MTTIKPGDIVSDADGVQWRVYAVTSRDPALPPALVLERNDTEGGYLMRAAALDDVQLVGQQLPLDDGREGAL